LPTRPTVVAELGPGDSLGTGLAALLTGAERYCGLDVIRYANREHNLAVLDGLVGLLRARADIPGPEEFPQVLPTLADFRFPRDILPDDLLTRTLADDRLDRVRRSIVDAEAPGSMIGYFVPWLSREVAQSGTVDLVFSQAVLQCVEDLETTYGTLQAWLRPGGVMSHQMSFECFGTADQWNGHWTRSDLAWRLIKGRRPFLINRQPWSGHERELRAAGFEIVFTQKARRPSSLSRQELAPRFRNLPDEDLGTSGAFVLAVKRPD